MVQRGRKSAASLSVVPVLADPPEPPDELTPEGRVLWDEIVRSRGQFPPPSDTLLAAYISHFVAARALAKLAREVDGDDIRALNRLLTMHARETASMARLVGTSAPPGRNEVGANTSSLV